MKPYRFLLIAILGILLGTSACQSPKEKAEEPAKSAYKYDFKQVEGDPTNALVYTLDNGLKVYLSVNRDEPRIQTVIGVRAGSKNDPADATGLAHYLEHMLFKGSSEIATLDWEKEKVLLQQISDLYEQQRNETDPATKKGIYAKIDSLSGEAAKYTVPNEYDKMVTSIGAKNTNAFTSSEVTAYINDIPATELKKWMSIESVRMQELVLRLFHTELETVYEEFNRGQDNDYGKASKAHDALMFLEHPYGTQTTIGTGEHLKNPSMEKIHEYFTNWYVPNNMAIILAGDLDPDATMDMIVEYFGGWKKRPFPEFNPPVEAPIEEVRSAEVLGPRGEFVRIGFRFPGASSEDVLMLDLIDGIMANGQAGLLDLNLEKAQKVIAPVSYLDVRADYSGFMLRGIPKQDQTLEEVRDLLLGQLELLKEGQFEDWMIPAVVRNSKLNTIRRMARSSSRAFEMLGGFVLGMDRETIASKYDRMGAFTKQDVMEFAKKHFNDNNYTIVYKRTGEDPDLHKVDKPQITPIDINREVQSEFAKQFDAMESDRLDPIFLDFEKEIAQKELNGGIGLSYIENESNELFELNYILDMGTRHDRKLGMAVNYLPYLGTDKHSAEDLSKEFFKLGVDFNVYAGDERIYVTLRGLEESLEQGLELFEHLLANAQPDAEKLQALIADELKNRADAKKEKFYIQQRAMVSYAKYGAENPFNAVLSDEEMMGLDAEEMVKLIHSIPNTEHQVFYFGSKEMEKVAETLNQKHKIAEQLNPIPAKVEYAELPTERNEVFFVNYDMVQTEIYLVSKSKPYSQEIQPYASIFQQYFGSGLSSIVFQEIRESKALAYSAYSFYSTPSEADQSHYVYGYLGTQADKLNDAVDALLELLNNMPEAEDQFQKSKLAALKKIESDRITGQSVFWTYLGYQKLGHQTDIRKASYEAIEKMEMKDLKAFFDENIAGSNYKFLVIGNKENVDFKALEKLGPMQELTLEELFGY